MAPYAPLALFFALLSFLSVLVLPVLASPFLPIQTEVAYLKKVVASPVTPVDLARRQDDSQPTFPDQPPSCPICAQNFGSIDSCAQAAPVLANFSMIIFNPGAFIDVIKCACADTFQSAYPQCVDCFTQTNQTQFLNSDDLPGVLQGIHNICGIESSLLGGVATADGEVTPTTSLDVPKATGTTSGAASLTSRADVVIALVVISSILAAML